MSIPTILEAAADPEIFGPQFKDPESWSAWSAFNAALFGLPMADEQLAIYRECTAREDGPTEPASEAWLVVGRRGGKSRDLALIASYAAAFIDWRPYLAAGERGYIVIVAADRRQCRTIMSYMRAMLLGTPILAELVTGDTAEALELTNGLTIEVATCSYRTIRGRTVVLALCDEAAFWADDDGANPASEVIASLRPAMATIPGAMLLVASSPYSKRGPLYDAHRRFFGKSGRVLVWQAPTRRMNPNIPQSFIDEAYERDDISARAEYGALFRSDIDGYVSREVVDHAVVPERRELMRVTGIRYFGFVDPSGGGADSFTLAIAHLDATGVILDATREWRPPLSPDAVVKECSILLKSYGIDRVTGDNYAKEWPQERFRVHGIRYDVCKKPKSELYLELLPLLNSDRAELLDDPRLVGQLCGLERHTARSGRDAVMKAPGMHDDLANSVAGVLVLANASAEDEIPNIRLDAATFHRENPVRSMNYN